VAVREAALRERVGVGLVEQPYRVKERRSPAPTNQLDAAWEAVVTPHRRRNRRGPVVCLAFPLQPPRRAGKAAAPSRLVELEAVAVPTLVVQGTLDLFGVPHAGGQRTVVEVPGDHSLKADLAAVSAAVQSWLAALLVSRASKM